MPSARNIAIQVCQYLERQGYQVDTSRILRECSLEGHRPMVLKVCHSLTKRGVLSRRGDGKFRWGLANKAWNRVNPFNTEPIGDVKDEELGYFVSKPTPKTFDKKDALRDLNCHFHKNRPGHANGWYAVDVVTRDKARAILGLKDGDDDTKGDPDPDAKDAGDTPPNPALIGKLAGLENKLRDSEAIIDKLSKDLSTKAAELEDVKANSNRAVKKLIIKHADEVVAKLEDVVLPNEFEHVLQLAAARRNILLVGPSGCGKTHLSKLVADALGLEFSSISFTAGASEAHLLGRTVPNFTKGSSVFQGTAFLDRYENGGVFLGDELDGADPNLLLALNTALSNKYCNVPGRTDNPTAKRHKDFIFIGTANTYGRGANRTFVGRNQLDEATLDRFRIGLKECYYNSAVEAALCPETGEGYIPRSNGDNTTQVVVDKLVALGYGLRGTMQYVRERIEIAGLRRTMSTRFMEDAYVMHKAADWNLNKILTVFFEGWSADEKAKVA